MTMSTPTVVFVATYDHKHGSDVRVFKTEALALAWRDAIALEYWHEGCKGDPPSEGAGEAYFEAADHYEWFSVEAHPVLET